MEQITKEYRPRKREALLFRELEDGGAVYNPETEELHTFNNTAAYIWVLCTGNFTIREIITQIELDFDQEEVEVEKQVFQTIEKFIDLNLLKE